MAFLVADDIDLEQFLKRIVLHEAAFHDRRLVFKVNKSRLDLRVQTRPDEILVRIDRAEEGQQMDVIAEGGQMVRHRERAAGELVGAQMPRGEDRLLAGFSHRLAVGVFVNDGFANEQDFQIFRRFEVADDFLDRMPRREGSEVFAEFLRSGSQSAG